MMLNWDLAVIGSRLLVRADPRTGDKEVAWVPEPGAIVAMPAKAIDRMLSTARGFERIGFEPGSNPFCSLTNREGQTMKRQSKPPLMPAPRNPYVAAARFRQAGTHLKSGKALRRTGKMAAQRERDRLNRAFSDDSRTLGWPRAVQSIDKNDCTFLSVF